MSKRLGVVLVIAMTTVVLAACGSSGSSRKTIAPEIDPTDPLSATLLMQQAQALIAEGKVDQGIQKLDLAYELQPTNPTIINFLGVAEMRRKNLTKALEHFNRALTLAPTYSDARNNRGLAYRQLGQNALAEADFLAVLTDPMYANRAGVMVNLGVLYMGQGNLQAAKENLHRATTLSAPVDAYYLLGQVEERLGNAELAEKNLFEASRRAPERADILLYLGDYLTAAGRPQEAREFYQKILSTSPGSAEAAKARTKLGS